MAEGSGLASMAEAKNIGEGPAIGIDLGTTFSCAAVFRDGEIEIIPNEQGNNTTPSLVAFTDDERLVGEAALEQIGENVKNTIFDAKRLIGRKFDDPVVQNDIKQWPFKVVNVKGIPKLQVSERNEMKRFHAEQISAMILREMREIATSYLNAKVMSAVITVPAYFNDMQRTATRDAARIAGLNVLRIINEPTAAAIAYGLNNNTKIAKNILVFDLGGGTFDVSILNMHESDFEVKAVGGDTHLGGEDFDNRMMQSLVAEFERKNGVDISGDQKAMRQLRTKCEIAKRILSSAHQTTIEIDSLYDEIDFEKCITRVQFEEMCDDLFGLTMKLVGGALKDANLKSSDIDSIVLVGGSTRIPKIQQLLQGLFPGKEIRRTINADEAVARGAAILAAKLHGDATIEMENLKLTEVTPLTLGIRVKRVGDDLKRMSAVIKRNTCLPVCKSEIYPTLVDNQTKMRITVLQGELQLAEDNHIIGQFTIDGIPAAPAKAEKVIVTFSIDENGILTVNAVSESNANARGAITIKNVSGSLTKAEIDRMVAEAEKFSELDRDAKQRTTARWELEQFCVEMKDKCNEVLTRLSSCNRPTLTQFSQWKSELVALTQEEVKLEQLDQLDPCVFDDDSVIEIVPNGDLVIDVDSDN